MGGAAQNAAPPSTPIGAGPHGDSGMQGGGLAGEYPGAPKPKPALSDAEKQQVVANLFGDFGKALDANDQMRADSISQMNARARASQVPITFDPSPVLMPVTTQTTIARRGFLK